MKKVLLIRDDAIGENGALGQKLICGFLATMKDCKSLPSAIYLLNRGVFLSTQNEATIAALKALEERGVAIYSCHTCLEHYGLLDAIKVGEVGNAKDTLEALLSAGNSVTL